jgi:hypothetical protein
MVPRATSREGKALVMGQLEGQLWEHNVILSSKEPVALGKVTEVHVIALSGCHGAISEMDDKDRPSKITTLDNAIERLLEY